MRDTPDRTERESEELVANQSPVGRHSEIAAQTIGSVKLTHMGSDARDTDPCLWPEEEPRPRARTRTRKTADSSCQ